MFALLGQFSEGVIDALRIPDALILIMMNAELRWLNIKCFVLNGLLYLGTVLVYTAFTSMLFYGSSNPDADPIESENDKVSDGNFVWQAIVTVIHLGMDMLHNSWVLTIYIATLVLTTFWVQDIFDYLMDLKIKQI